MTSAGTTAMNAPALERLFARIPDRAVGVVGDFCVDAYWELRPECGEPSIETGIVTTPVGAARYFPGGAGNLAANLRALGAEKLYCFGALGSDPFGDWLRRALCPDGGKGDRLLRVDRADYHTPVYCKPLLRGKEQSRLDLGGVPLAGDEAERLLEGIEAELATLDVLIVNQQLAHGIHSEHFRRKFAALLERKAGKLQVVFDGREHLDAYPGAILKINAAAASQLAFGRPDAPPGESGAAILRRTGRELVVTDGGRGCFVFGHHGPTFIPAIPYAGPTDTVGAGDSFTAGFSLALASGASVTEAAEFGNGCAALTIRKIAQTGVPSREELRALFAERR